MEFELNVNYLDCIKDSPGFRKYINLSFSKIINFQDVITEISEAFSQSVNSGVIFTRHYQIFCSKIEKLNKLYDNDIFQTDLNKILKIFVEYEKHFKSLMENFHTIQKDFRYFLEKFKEIECSKKYFQKASDNLDNSQQKCAASLKSKLNDNIDNDKQCNIARKDFMLTSLNYMSVFEKFEISKNSLFLRICTEILALKNKHYSDGNELMNRYDHLIEQLKNSKVSYDSFYEKKLIEIDNVFKILSDKNRISLVCDEPNTLKEGYLYKCPRKSWQKWQRRWFKVEDNQLLSCKRTDDIYSIVEPDLRICTARELIDTDRRFCFELIGLDHIHVLQADSEQLQKKWIECFQSGISSQIGTIKKQNPTVNEFSNSGSTRRLSRGSRKSVSYKKDNDCKKGEERKQNLLSNVLEVKGNSRCCDCNDPKPRWASSSLGITLCTECSGSHRSLGVHISKVRSLTLDNWEPEMLCVMFMLGNELVNQIFESDKQAIENARKDGIMKPDCNTDMNIRKLWTRAKWEKKQFVQSNNRELLASLEQYIKKNIVMLSGNLQEGYPYTSASDLLRYGLELHCLPLMMLALSFNANPNGDPNDDFIPLHLAASSDFWPGCEFLILNGAKLDIVDKTNQTALHKACQNENVLVVWLLLKRGARQNIRDNNDKEVLQIAMSTTNANTVTLLRLQTLNENVKEANLGSGGDETVKNVFSDFTNRAFDQIDEWFFSDIGSFSHFNGSKSQM